MSFATGYSPFHRYFKMAGTGGPRTGDGRMNIGDLVTLEELEREHIIQVLQKTPDLGTAARVLGIDPATLYRKRKRLSLGRHGQPASHAEQTEEHAHTVESNSGG